MKKTLMYSHVKTFEYLTNTLLMRLNDLHVRQAVCLWGFSVHHIILCSNVRWQYSFFKLSYEASIELSLGYFSYEFPFIFLIMVAFLQLPILLCPIFFCLWVYIPWRGGSITVMSTSFGLGCLNHLLQTYM